MNVLTKTLLVGASTLTLTATAATAASFAMRKVTAGTLAVSRG
jgi:hypothetical protein